jgi:hypothetical protein
MKINRQWGSKQACGPKHIDLLPQDQNLGLKRSSRLEKIREHPPDQAAHAPASPDSQSTNSRI